MAEEFIRMLNFEIVLLQLGLRKILQIVGHNDVAPPPDGGGNNMAIIRVREHNDRDQPLEVTDQGIPNTGIHQFPSSPYLFGL